MKGLSRLDVPKANRAVSAAGDQSAASDLHSPNGLPVALVCRKTLMRVSVPGLIAITAKTMVEGQGEGGEHKSVVCVPLSDGGGRIENQKMQSYNSFNS